MRGILGSVNTLLKVFSLPSFLSLPEGFNVSE